MKLLVKPNYVTVKEETDEDRKVLTKLLVFRDPSPYRYFDYRSGAWDGKHNFLVGESTAGRLRFLTGFVDVVYRGLKQAVAEGRIEPPKWRWEDTLNPPVPEEVPEDILAGVILRPYQIEAVEACLKAQRGVIHAPPRSGKTEIQAAVAKALDVSSLLLVDKGILLKQHHKRFQERGLEDVGRVGSGYKRYGCQHVIAMVQTFALALKKKNPEALELLDRCQLLQVDECHRLGSSAGMMDIFTRCEAPYRFAYSGTPLKDTQNKHFEADDFRLHGATGKVIYKITSKELQDGGFLSKPYLLMIVANKPKVTTTRDWHRIYHEGIVNNPYRNRLIVRLAKYLFKQGEVVLTLVRMLEHGDILLRMMDEEGIPSVFSSGGSNLATILNGTICREYEEVESLKDKIAAGDLPSIIGSSVFDEGVDIPDLTSVIIASGGKSSTRTLQRAYRGMTKVEGKDRSLIFDFRDTMSTVLAKHSRMRIKDYKAEGINVITRLPADFKKELGL
jgi:superfamily II DNA or RNA helicase